MTPAFDLPSKRRRAALPEERPVDLRVPLAVRAAPPERIRIPTNTHMRWRPLLEADVSVVLALENLCQDHDRVPYRTTAAEIRELFDPVVPHALYGAFTAAGQLVAYGCVRVRVGENDVVRASCSGAVSPHWRDRKIGTAIVEWQLDEARHLLAISGLDGPAQISHHIDGDMVAMAELLENNGFTARRRFTQMRRDLRLPLRPVTLTNFLTVMRWDPALDDAVRRVHNQAFSEYGQSLELSAQQWSRIRESMVLEWSFIALDRSSDRAQVAGYVMSSRWEEDWPALGWKEGYIESLGVLAPWRRRGLARALITHAMEAFRSSGMEFAGIDVSSEDAEATAMYERLGFEPAHHSTVYAIDL